MIAWLCDAPDEELDGSDEQPCGCRGDGLLEVLGETAVPIEPCQGPLDDPTARQQLEAFSGIGSLDDLDAPLAKAAQRSLELVPGPSAALQALRINCAAIGEQVSQPREAVDDLGEQQGRAIAVLDVGGVDQGVDQVALGVGQDMALAALDLLARIIAARTAGFRRFDTLAVNHPGTGRSLAAMGFTRGHQQVVVEAAPQAIVAPKVEPAPHRRDRREARRYGALPTIRITDVLSQVARWTGFIDQFGHVSSGLPPSDERAFLAALIAEATNLGLTRMADVCGVASRRALLRMQTWHMREDTFRAALGCLTDAIHAEPIAAWFGEGWRASADGQHFYLGGPGESGGTVNAHYGRDPIVKIYTTITDRYAPLHQTVIAGTAGEAIHALDGILGHESGATIASLHADGGGVSDIVFAVMHLLGLNFEPRIPRLSYRRLYAFEPRARYGKLAPLFGHRLDESLIRAHWDDIGPVIDAMRNRVVTPSLILKKLSAFRQQNALAAALREIGRVERTLFTLRWFEEPALRKQVTAELNKGEARNTLARAVAFHRLGRFRDRGHENQQTRAAALNLVTAAIILFNCRYLDPAVASLKLGARIGNEEALRQLSPLGWDHINLTGDYVWSDPAAFDADGFLPLKISER